MSATTKTRIDSKLVNINSTNAFVKNNGTYNSNVVFNFPGLVKPEQHITGVKFQLVDAQIPVSFYNINYTNNTLNYQISSVNYSITADVGNYNFNSLASQLIAKFLANGHIFTITINKQNGIITLATPATNFILQVSSMFSVLGLLLSNHTSSSFSLTADYPLNLLGIAKIKIQSSNMNTYNLDSYTSGFSNNIGLIPVDQPSFGLIIYENKSNAKFILRDNRVDEIDIQLVDQNNNLINFNNIDWNLTFLIETTYEVESPSQTQMSDILKEQNKLLADLSQSQEPPPAQEQPINPITTDDLDFFLYSNPNLVI
jgi:hypothetical protein